MLRLAKLLDSDYVDKDIHINSISPSMIDTNFLNNMKKFFELNAYNHPLKGNAHVTDITPIKNFNLK